MFNKLLGKKDGPASATNGSPKKVSNFNLHNSNELFKF